MLLNSAQELIEIEAWLLLTFFIFTNSIVNFAKMVKHTQKTRPQQLTNYLSVFDHFVRMVLKGLKGANV